MKVQLVRFRRKRDTSWEAGIAYLETFDVSDIRFIIDSDGYRLSKHQVWTYELVRHPHYGYLDLSLVNTEEKRSAKELTK